jgi:hypothetical protein
MRVIVALVSLAMERGRRRDLRYIAMMFLLAAVLIFAHSQAPEVHLYAGVHGPPPGWADGLKHSVSSFRACKKLFAEVPKGQERGMSCIVRVDPQAPPPTS